MTLTKQHLRNAFDSAINEKTEFVFVLIDADGTKEVIAIPSGSFIAKLDFYEKAYDDKLQHVMNKSVSIRGVTHGNVEALRDLI